MIPPSIKTIQSQWQKISLGNKLIILVAASLTLVLCFTSYLNIKAQQHLLYERLEDRAKMLGNFFLLTNSISLLTYDYIALNNNMRVMTHQRDIAFAILFNNEEKNVTNYLDITNPYVKQAIDFYGSDDLSSVVSFLEKKEDIMSMAIPVHLKGQDLGTIKMGISTKSTDKLLHQMVINHLLTNLLIIIVAISCLYFFFRKTALGPIQALIDGSSRVAQGDFDKEIIVHRNDELGRLAQTFNQMIERMRKNKIEREDEIVNLQNMYKTSEKRIDEYIKKLEHANHELERLSLYDAVIGLPNRALFLDRLKQQVDMSNRSYEPLAVMIFTIANFKEIQEELKSKATKSILKEIGSRIKNVLRMTDTVARTGEDEFAVLVPGSTTEKAVLVAKKIVNTFEQQFKSGQKSLKIEIHLGIALNPEHGQDPSTLLQRANTAMCIALAENSRFALYDASKELA